jgi:hypothetical protein
MNHKRAIVTQSVVGGSIHRIVKKSKFKMQNDTPNAKCAFGVMLGIFLHLYLRGLAVLRLSHKRYERPGVACDDRTNQAGWCLYASNSEHVKALAADDFSGDDLAAVVGLRSHVRTSWFALGVLAGHMLAAFK